MRRRCRATASSLAPLMDSEICVKHASSPRLRPPSAADAVRLGARCLLALARH